MQFKEIVIFEMLPFNSHNRHVLAGADPDCRTERSCDSQNLKLMF